MWPNLGHVEATALDVAYDARDALQRLHASHIERVEGEIRRGEGDVRRGEGETRHEERRDRARCGHVMGKLIRVSSITYIL